MGGGPGEGTPLPQPSPNGASTSASADWVSAKAPGADWHQRVLAAQGSGSISTATAAKELRQSSETTGVFSNITDEDIAALARRFDERCRVVMMLRSYVTATKLARAIAHASEIVLDHIERRIIVLRGDDPGSFT